jgi:hypothetical protein
MLIKTFTKIVVAAALLTGSLGACVSSDDEAPRTPAGTEEAPATLGTSQQLISCTPGAKVCDFSCYLSGGPSSDDCIVKCNAAGTAFVPFQNCGWAQNSVYSSSCLDLPPNNAICKWN